MTEAFSELIADKMAQNDRVLALLGIEVEEVKAGFARLSMTISEQMLNGFGIAHGGITFTLADTAFAYACNSRNRLTVAANCQVKFTKMVHQGDKLTAIATERSLDDRKGIYDVRVEDQDGEVVAIFEGTSHGLDQRVVPELGV
jgi:acyl-CoA thioesterase